MLSPILFYEPEYYFLSNFSSFAITWEGDTYMTTEHVYQSEKFEDKKIKIEIRNASSSHDALRIAKKHRSEYRKEWDDVKLGIMKSILVEKVKQHEYIREKLLESGDREIFENSPVDDFWGWGNTKDGANHLGKLWMEIRSELVLEK